jgi:hypothetical protein
MKVLAAMAVSVGLVLTPPAKAGPLEIAKRYLGARNVTGFRGPWCKAFTNKVLREAGFQASAGLRAIDALRDGFRVGTPSPGDLAVMRGHVTFFVSWGGRGFLGLGGNQQHGRVALSSFPTRKVVAWVRPGGYR